MSLTTCLSTSPVDLAGRRLSLRAHLFCNLNCLVARANDQNGRAPASTVAVGVIIASVRAVWIYAANGIGAVRSARGWTAPLVVLLSSLPHAVLVTPRVWLKYSQVPALLGSSSSSLS